MTKPKPADLLPLLSELSPESQAELHIMAREIKRRVQAASNAHNGRGQPFGKMSAIELLFALVLKGYL